MSRRLSLCGRAWLALVLVLAATVTASCGGLAPAPEPSGTPTAPAPPPEPGTGDARVTGRPGTPSEVATDLPVPWSIAQLPAGGYLVSLRDEARVVLVLADGSVTDLPSTGEGGRVPGVVPAGEGGLLGLALSPGFDDDRLVYAYATTADGNEVVRMRLDGERLREPEVLLSGIPAGPVHNGGRLAFGPDGMLYVTTGDAGRSGTAQDLDSLGGKILRVTPDGAPPPGNPFDGSPVWSYGHRNVQGIGWDRQGRMYASEFGQDAFDELNLVAPGGNYGWPLVEGGGGAPEYVDPLVTWSTDEASPSGIAVTDDAVYLAALRGQRLWRVPVSDGVVGPPEPFLSGELGRLRDVVATPDGDLLVLTNNTARGDPGEDDDRLVSLALG